MFGTDIALKVFKNNINDRPVLIYGDPDPDGLFSLWLVTQLLEKLEVKYTYFVNEKRLHGLTLLPSTLKGYFVIAVDFQIRVDEINALVKNNVSLLNLDHHDLKDDFIYITGENGAEAVVLNNQYHFEPEDNRYNSGAGVVYEAFCEMFPDFKSEEREAIVGITLLSDARPLENDKAREYLKTTFSSDSQRGYIGYLVQSITEGNFGFGVPRLDRNLIDYNLSPKINSMLRFGYLNDAINFVLGRGLNQKETQKRQTSLVSTLKDRAMYLSLSNLTVIVIDERDCVDLEGVDLTCFIGYLCSSVKNVGVSTLGIVMRNGQVLRTSFRGRYGDVDYLTGMVNLGINAEGHKFAFGIRDFEPTESTWDEINEYIRQVEENHNLTIKVIETSSLSYTMLQMGAKLASENCYVRDMYRYYIRYTGKNIQVVKRSFKMEELTEIQIAQGVKANYLRDENGNPIPKYIEYLVDGRTIKSFGVLIEEGLILPIYEKGHIQLYVKENID